MVCGGKPGCMVLHPVTKTVVEPFGSAVCSADSFFVDGEVKVKSGCVRCRGIVFNAQLSFDTHVLQVLEKANKAIRSLPMLNARFSLFSYRSEEQMWQSTATSRLWGVELYKRLVIARPNTNSLPGNLRACPPNISFGFLQL